MKNLETRIEKLENYQESINPEKLTILKLCYERVRNPTDEEVEAAKKKFMESHPGHQGHIVLNFLHLGDREHSD
jgi:hypothetical protein